MRPYKNPYPLRRAVEIFTRLRHPGLQSAQETLAEIERSMQKSE